MSVDGAEYVVGVPGTVSLVLVTTWSNRSVMLKEVIFPRESVEMTTSRAALPALGIVLVSMKLDTVDVMSSVDRLSSAVPVNDVSNEIET